MAASSAVMSKMLGRAAGVADLAEPRSSGAAQSLKVVRVLQPASAWSASEVSEPAHGPAIAGGDSADTGAAASAGRCGAAARPAARAAVTATTASAHARRRIRSPRLLVPTGRAVPATARVRSVSGALCRPQHQRRRSPVGAALQQLSGRRTGPTRRCCSGRSVRRPGTASRRARRLAPVEHVPAVGPDVRTRPDLPHRVGRAGGCQPTCSARSTQGHIRCES